MAQITLNIPDAVLPRVVDALATDGGYDMLVDPPTKAVFARQQVIAYVKRVVVQTEAAQAAQAAQDAAHAAADADIIIT